MILELVLATLVASGSSDKDNTEVEYDTAEQCMSSDYFADDYRFEFCCTQNPKTKKYVVRLHNAAGRCPYGGEEE